MWGRLVAMIEPFIPRFRNLEMALEKDTLSKFLQEDGASREILQTECEALKTNDLKEMIPFGRCGLSGREPRRGVPLQGSVSCSVGRSIRRSPCDSFLLPQLLSMEGAST